LRPDRWLLHILVSKFDIFEIFAVACSLAEKLNRSGDVHKPIVVDKITTMFCKFLLAYQLVDDSYAITKFDFSVFLVLLMVF